MARERDAEAETRRLLGYDLDDRDPYAESRRQLGYDILDTAPQDDELPFAEEIDEVLDTEEVGVPTDEFGRSLIPELEHRDPTHNERVLIAGTVIAMASTNVKDIWWNWRGPQLFVRFLDDSLYVYHGVSLTTAIGMIETLSPGRYVWNTLRDLYPYQRLERGTARRRPQVVRLINR